jgi:hypothetical protein
MSRGSSWVICDRVQLEGTIGSCRFVPEQTFRLHQCAVLHESQWRTGDVHAPLMSMPLKAACMPRSNLARSRLKRVGFASVLELAQEQAKRSLSCTVSLRHRAEKLLRPLDGTVPAGAIDFPPPRCRWPVAIFHDDRKVVWLGRAHTLALQIEFDAVDYGRRDGTMPR